MSSSLRLSGPTQLLPATIYLPGSKSISNRLLIINALSKSDKPIINLSPSDDTKILKSNLESDLPTLDFKHGGAPLRFAVAFFAIADEEVILTGSDRLKQRPIKRLVDALNEIGADISYENEYGFAPVKIKPFKRQLNKTVEIDSTISSQFISALCMIAPYLDQGLTIKLKGAPVSNSYLKMTLDIMKQFGARFDFNGSTIRIDSGKYLGLNFEVESDWSSASYYYVILSGYNEGKIQLKHLSKSSLQGDAIMMEIGKLFGITSKMEGDTLILKKSNPEDGSELLDFINCPDIAQSVAVMSALTAKELIMSGLETLKIKETDRINALSTELEKFGTKFSEIKTGMYRVEGQLKPSSETIQTYSDHRMALSFAALASRFPITIQDPEVISKSYPGYWKDLQKLGFTFQS